MNTQQITAQHPADFGLLPQASIAESRPAAVDASQTLADFAVGKKKSVLSAAGTSGTTVLRQPDAAAAMPTGDIVSGIAQRVSGRTPSQVLAQLADETTVTGGTARGFDISRLNTSQIAALFAVILQALQTGKTAERQNQADMALVKGRMAEGAASAMRASGQTALNGAISQASFGLSISGAGFALQQKGINRERAMLQNDQTSLLKQQNALDAARLNSAKGGSSALESASVSGGVRLDTVDGGNVAVRQNTAGVRPRHQAHIDEAAQMRLKKDIGVAEIDIRDKQAKADAIKAKGMLISQMSHPTTGILGGNTQVMQADENAQQHLHQQSGQVASGLADTSNANARDFDSLIQTVAQKLADIQRAHLDTAGMIAGKSV
ncbi:IpaC/SipC family type III secretion system effector [Martelella alba]|uniref:Effector protein BipC n=1 Tax=Martelella alba TaxID=2590451 RepID=A0ABY2SK05_9HYPH|nr:IpaC/SipC family type III secretion system effector [Martelella alba]TKI05074.1 hypothetical protein FCN80_15310 [Martelella alba]